MKKLLFISFLFVSLGLFSQGNLQFNQVIQLSGTERVTGLTGSVSTGWKNVSTITIPDGKVWKIESADMSVWDDNRSFASGGLQKGSIQFGDFVLYKFSGNHYIHQKWPIWLKSGSYQLKLVNGESTDSSSLHYQIFALEFNIVQ